MIKKIERQPMLQQVTVKDQFWTYFQNLIIDFVIPYQEQILRDQIPDAEKSHAIENFRIAARLSEGEFYGMVFQDSDVAKWMEAVSNAIAISDKPEFEEKADEIIDLIGKAQEPDGYLDTFFQIGREDKKWTNLLECHELYCMGHMIEATVAHYCSTGKKNFLNIGIKIADCIDNRFGPGKHRGIPGHPEIELALMRLYEVTGNERYKKLAKYFIDERGTQPDFFKEEGKTRKISIWNMEAMGPEYNQDNLPLRDISEAVGHSVRAVYLYTAMADLASETDDEELYHAAERVWDNIVSKKMYITGSIGSTAEGEAFTINYDLPNDTIYAETCAAVGLIFFARKMLQIKPCSKYADIMEKCFFNGMLSGMQHDGKRFFYVNPLEVVPELDGKVPGFKHVLPKRPKWYACACCPPNVARLLTSISRYCWGENEHQIYSHMALGGEYRSSSIEGVTISCNSEYPWNGKYQYHIKNVNNKKFDFLVHIPGHARDTVITVNGVRPNPQVTDGYAKLSGLKDGDEVLITFDMPVRKVYANTNVRNDAGLVAIMRGPVVYAAEECDNGNQLYNIVLPGDSSISCEKKSDPVIGEYTALATEGIRYHSDSNELYTEQKPSYEKQKLTMIPYYLWGNRTIGEMRVWLREE